MLLHLLPRRDDAPPLNNEANLAQQDEADQKALLTNKKRFWAAGFATYGDIDILALVGMQEEKFKDYFSRIARRFPLVIVDECQDLSAEQLLIVKRLSLLGVKFHFVGDLNQSIYGFRKSNPASVRRRMEELGFEEYVLNENRNPTGLRAVKTCRSGLAGCHR
ncbi:UvrD-helicase domain-containing protein [Pseudomonas sp. NPDC089996]|uniref:UvrD-helicase domain-containing protein n=1 Tax=Pseudomonas sp. NPDC089996 TaxID=3364474 RepID=UPI00381B1244